MFVTGRYVGNIPHEAIAGLIGNAVVNFGKIPPPACLKIPGFGRCHKKEPKSFSYLGSLQC
jgi:hypothetical protein